MVFTFIAYLKHLQHWKKTIIPVLNEGNCYLDGVYDFERYNPKTRNFVVGDLSENFELVEELILQAITKSNYRDWQYNREGELDSNGKPFPEDALAITASEVTYKEKPVYVKIFQPFSNNPVLVIHFHDTPSDDLFPDYLKK